MTLDSQLLSPLLNETRSSNTEPSWTEIMVYIVIYLTKFRWHLVEVEFANAVISLVYCFLWLHSGYSRLLPGAILFSFCWVFTVDHERMML